MKRLPSTAAFVSFALLAPLAPSARADVKIVSTVSVVGQAPHPSDAFGRGPAYPRTVTACYQGANSRTEVAGGLVVLYTGQDGKTTILDPVSKTYFVISGEPGGGGPGAMSALANLKPSSGTQILAGSPAKKFLLSGSLKRDFGSPPLGGEEGFGGRFLRRPPRAQAATVSGEVWLSSTLKLPLTAKEALVPLLREAVPGAGPLAMLVASSVAQTHELPLLAKITLTPAAPPVLGGEAAPPADVPKPAPTVATLNVTSVSTAALNPALFAVPQGYTQAVPPRPPHRNPNDRGQFGGPPPPGLGRNDGPPPPDNDINTAPTLAGGEMNTAPQGVGGMDTAPQSGGGMNTAPLPPDSSMDPAAQ